MTHVSLSTDSCTGSQFITSSALWTQNSNKDIGHIGGIVNAIGPAKIVQVSISKKGVEPGKMAHTCNSSYSGGRDWRVTVQGQLGQKVSETPISTNTNWA
jgi:hypothetical protein